MRAKNYTLPISFKIFFRMSADAGAAVAGGAAAPGVPREIARRPRAASRAENGGDGLDLHQLAGVAEHGDPHQGARHVVRAEGQAMSNSLPSGSFIATP
jgi:hypothetical protein